MSHFKEENIINELITIKGIRGRLNVNGDPELNLEDVVRGWGFTRIAGSGNEVVRWERVRGYLEELNIIPTSGHDKNKVELSGRDDLPEYIAENIVYKLGFKAKNEVAIQFQNLLADEILPTIRKTGGYVANEDLFINTYLPYADDAVKEMFKSTLFVVRKQNETIQKQQKEILHKEDVIIGLVDDITLAEKRQILNRVVKKTTSGNYAERYNELYKQFEMKYHCDLTRRFESEKDKHKPKIKNKMDYIDRAMKKIPELYEIAAKLYENDVKTLVEEIYGLERP